MKERIKNTTILEKTVRPDKAKMLKQVQHDMFVLDDMEVSRHCERMRSNPANYFARSANKVFSPLTFHFSPKDTLTSHFSRRAASRIIRVVAGVTSRSTSRVGFAIAHTAPYRKFGFTLAEGATHVARQHNKRRAAFTLAEVLITLGIIGVVAAMTLPSLIQKYQEHIAVSKVKKFYSVMSQALMLSIKDNGPVNEWNITQYDEENKIYSANNMFEQYLVPYLKISKYCGDKSGCLSNVQYRALNGEAGNNYETLTKYAKAILADGTYFWGRVNDRGICSKDMAGGGKIPVENVCGVLFVDVNGKKNPNTIGKDTFSFFLQPNRIIPIPEDDCHLNAYGWGCSASIIQNGKLNYLHE